MTKGPRLGFQYLFCSISLLCFALTVKLQTHPSYVQQQASGVVTCDWSPDANRTKSTLEQVAF